MVAAEEVVVGALDAAAAASKSDVEGSGSMLAKRWCEGAALPFPLRLGGILR